MKNSSFDVMVLDCDGVIFDTNQLKVQALKKALCKYPSADVTEMAQYMRSNFGQGRHQLFSYFLETYAPDKKSDLPSLLESYGQQCQSIYRLAKFTEGFLKFCSALPPSCQLHVASGNAGHELEDAFQARNIRQHFGRIYGSPHTKVQALEEIKECSPNKKIVMIGDAYADFSAAQQTNLPFIYVNAYSTDQERMQQLAKKHSFLTIESLGDLLLAA